MWTTLLQVDQHPTTSQDLDRIIREFASANTHLATKETGTSDEREVFATQFVTKCQAPSERNAIAVQLFQIRSDLNGLNSITMM